MGKYALVDKILKKVPSATKSWANLEEVPEGFLITPKAEPRWQHLVSGYTIVDGLESFAEFNVKHEDADFRKVAREISREQWGKIKITNKIVSAIVQHGAFGEETY